MSLVTRVDAMKLPVISGQQCITILERIGYEITRTRGSHVRLTRRGRASVSVPLHAELDRGTLRSILRTTEVSVEEFTRVLREG